jgi:acyl-CoA thioester hydrolase
MDIRIYYEDTDAAGVVYHANYIKYFDRARTEFFRNRGFSVSNLAEAGFIFPVVRMEINYTVPARLDDLLFIETVPTQVGGSSCTLCQRIYRKDDGKLLANCQVTLVCVNVNLKAQRIPADIRTLLESELAND